MIDEPKVDGAVVVDDDGDTWTRRNGLWTCDRFNNSYSSELYKDRVWDEVQTPVAISYIPPTEPTVAVKDVVAALGDNLPYLSITTRERILDALGIKPPKKVVRATIEVEVTDDGLVGWDFSNEEEQHEFVSTITVFDVESFEVIEK